MKRVIKAAIDSDIYYWDGRTEVPKGVVSVVIEDGVKEIRRAAFSERTNLTNVTIPDSVTYIGR